MKLQRVLIGLALVAGVTAGARQVPEQYPAPVVLNHTLTPGAILTSDEKVVCSPGYAKSVRDVPDDLRTAAFRNYGLRRPTNYEGRYEVDHLISLELGGSNALTNLWPEPAPEYKQKDKIENAAHRAVCSGKMKLIDAQFKISQDWRALGQELGVK